MTDRQCKTVYDCRLLESDVTHDEPGGIELQQRHRLICILSISGKLGRVLTKFTEIKRQMGGIECGGATTGGICGEWRWTWKIELG